MQRNITLYPWFKFLQSLVFWQATWFLYLQKELSAADAILLYAVYDVATTVLEVPSGYMSDKLGRRITLLWAGVAGAVGAICLAVGESFLAFCAGQTMLGAATAFASGTDSSLLYESLHEDGRGGEIEAQELKAWRFGFAGFAISAVTGGWMALANERWPFYAGALAFVVLLWIVILCREPRRKDGSLWDTRVSMAIIATSLRNPVLVWLFALAVLMYGFSHLHFVFGQPFILEALGGTGLQTEAPLISGLVSATMMIVSVLSSLIALRLRQTIGLAAILLLAFGMQVGLAAIFSATNSSWAVALLFLRMVPISFSQPFITARIQPLLPNEARATYLSIQGLVARLAFAGSLFVASNSVTQGGPMPYSDIKAILFWYAAFGFCALVALALACLRIDLEPAQSNKV